MRTSLNFARRPFRNERPVFLAIGGALILAAILAFANWRLYRAFLFSAGIVFGYILFR